MPNVPPSSFYISHSRATSIQVGPCSPHVQLATASPMGPFHVMSNSAIGRGLAVNDSPQTAIFRAAVTSWRIYQRSFELA